MVTRLTYHRLDCGSHVARCQDTGRIMMRTVSVASVALAVSGGAALHAQLDTRTSVLRLGAYVEAWERDLGSVVADERYVQSVARQPRSELSRERLVPPRETRVLHSEFTLIRFDDGPTEWVGFRHILSVDGVAVTVPGPSLQALMQDPRLTWRQRWERVRDLSSAYNIGAIARTVNLPTLALSALRPANQRRFRFSPRQAEVLAGETSRVLEFLEQARPTLVSGLGGRDVPLRGQVWFDERTGSVRRTSLELRDHIVPTSDGDGDRDRDQELTSRITVDFAPDANVGVWVPAEMRERYDNSWGETTTGHATYGNYRRFQTSVKLVRPVG
jgi:hypothetical protein